jgi:hypothetical protein
MAPTTYTSPSPTVSSVHQAHHRRRVLTIIDGGMDQAFPPMRSHAPSSGPPAFSHAISSSPALYQSRPAAPPARRLDGPPVTSAESSYSSGFPRISSPYGAAHSTDYSMASSQTIPSISGLTQGSLSSPPISHNSSSMMGQFNQSIPRLVDLSTKNSRTHANGV